DVLRAMAHAQLPEFDESINRGVLAPAGVLDDSPVDLCERAEPHFSGLPVRRGLELERDERIAARFEPQLTVNVGDQSVEVNPRFRCVLAVLYVVDLVLEPTTLLAPSGVHVIWFVDLGLAELAEDGVRQLHSAPRG